jgi:anhydro-N-acetylmuramic acid kinase
VNETLLQQLLADEYYEKAPPKSTGREKYNPDFVAKMVDENPHISPTDLVATATRFTAETVKVAYERFIKPHAQLDELLASGGGTLNSFLMAELQICFGEIPVKVTDDFGVPSEAKEALCFAVLAHEFLNGVPANMPSVTGASGAAILGKLAYCVGR